MGVSCPFGISVLFVVEQLQLWARNEADDGGGVKSVGSIEYDDEDEDDEDMAVDDDDDEEEEDAWDDVAVLLFVFSLVLTVLFSESQLVLTCFRAKSWLVYVCWIVSCEFEIISSKKI